jgi:hypothetical protein
MELCNLSPDALRERLAQVRAEILPHVVAQARRSDGFDLDFRDTAETRARLEQWVALERQCCGGLRWELESGEAGGLRLSVTGVDPDSPAFQRLLDAG